MYIEIIYRVMKKGLRSVGVENNKPGAEWIRIGRTSVENINWSKTSSKVHQF